MSSITEVKNDTGREVKTPEKPPSVADYRRFLKLRKSVRSLPAYSKMRKNELKKIADALGFIGENPKVSDYKTFLREYRAANSVPAYSKLRKKELKALAERFGFLEKFYTSVTITYEWRVGGTTRETTWRTDTITFSTLSDSKIDINKKALKAASDIAQTYMRQEYQPEIRNIEIVSSTRIKTTATELKNIKLYARGYSYINLKMNNEFSQNDQCVYDFLKTKRERIFNKLSKDEQKELIGITSADLMTMLGRFNVSIIIEDLLNRPILTRLIGNKDRDSNFKQRITPIMLKIANNHIYVIDDKKERDCMKKRAVASSTSRPSTVEKKIPNYKFINGSPTELKQLINETKEHTHYYTDDNIKEVFMMYLREDKAPCVSLVNDNITEIRVGNVTIKHLPDGEKHFDSIQQLKSDIDEKHKISILSSSYGSIVSELSAALNVNVEKSVLNNTVRELFSKISTGGLTERFYNETPCKSSKRYLGLDKKNAYPSALIELIKDIPVYDINDKFEYGEFTIVEPCSFYIVKHNNTDVGDQMLHSNSLNIAIKIGLIKFGQVKAILRGRPMKNPSDITKFVNTCLSLHSGKYLINSFIGLQARMDIVSQSKNIITKSREEAINYYLQNGDPLNNQFIQLRDSASFTEGKNRDSASSADVNAQTYIVNMVSRSENAYVSKPMYLAITQYTRLRMLEAKHDLEKLGGTVCEIKTDCIFFSIPDKSSKDYKKWASKNVFTKKSATLGRFKREKPEKISASFHNQNKQRPEGVRILNRIIDEDAVREKTNSILPITKMHKPTVADIMKYNRAVISGPGGSGKSYLLSRMVKKFENQNLKCKVVSPTNISAFVLTENLEECEAVTESKTIHSSLGIDFKKQSITNAKSVSKIDVLIVDECSMITKAIWGVLLNILRQNPNIKFYAFGDYRQLPPIENHAVCFTELPILAELFEILIELTYNYRTNGNDDFVKFCKDIHDKKIKLEDMEFGSDAQDFAICKTNRMRKGFNVHKMDKHAPDNTEYETYEKVSGGGSPVINPRFLTKLKDANGLTGEEDDIEQLQPMKIYEGLPVQCLNRQMSQKLKYSFMRREFMKVVKFNKDFVYVENSKATHRMSKNEFCGIFIPAYASTVHSIQGRTLNKPYCILEYNAMTSKQLYTALTRTTRPENISLCNKLYGCNQSVLDYTYSLLDTVLYGYIVKLCDEIHYETKEPLEYIRKVRYYDESELVDLVNAYGRL